MTLYPSKKKTPNPNRKRSWAMGTELEYDQAEEAPRRSVSLLSAASISTSSQRSSCVASAAAAAPGQADGSPCSSRWLVSNCSSSRMLCANTVRSSRSSSLFWEGMVRWEGAGGQQGG